MATDTHEQARMREPADEAVDVILHMINTRRRGFTVHEEMKKRLSDALVKLGEKAAGTVCTGGPW